MVTSRVRYPKTLMHPAHSIRETLAAQNRYNLWELKERKLRLPQLTLAESLQQFFELQQLMNALAPEAQATFLHHKTLEWIDLHTKLSRASKYLHHAAATGSPHGD